MPDLSNALISPLPPDGNPAALAGNWNRRLRFTRGTCSVLKRHRRAGAKKPSAGKSALAGHVEAWANAKIASGVPESECFLPFLSNSPKMVQCPICSKYVNPGKNLLCSVKGCGQTFHISCAKKNIGVSTSKPFKCPQHVCFNCKQGGQWRCVRCPMAAHPRCSPWPDHVLLLTNRPGRVVCWKHHNDWRREKEHSSPTTDVEEAFRRLPLPYVEEEFNIGSILKDVMENNSEPAPYIHIKRNIYLIKKKRDGDEADVGCINCKADSTCGDKCECRSLSVSCSKACHCSDLCTNRPFRKEKKIKVLKTKFCGWGVEALETIQQGDFVIEYIGEVIDDVQCEQRLWDMKRRGAANFYMCEIRKDFTIDATFKGNLSRFLNHSCDPNCKLEKWQVEGETRVGVFASRTIEAGEPLTYDYRFEHFGPVAKCHCGASNCQGFLGSKRKTDQVTSCWGCKKKRTSIGMLAAA